MQNKNLTPIKSIRIKCLDCVCGQKQVYPYRLGHRPKNTDNTQNS